MPSFQTSKSLIALVQVPNSGHLLFLMYDTANGFGYPSNKTGVWLKTVRLVNR